MAQWQKDRNYRQFRNEDGTFTYVITVDGQDVEVSKRIYRAYSSADRSERYGYERERGLLLSLEQFDEDGMQAAYSGEHHTPSAEDTALRKIQHSEIEATLEQLNPDERALIQQLYIMGISVRKIAERSGVYHRAVAYRRDKALEKLRNILSEDMQ